MTSDDALVELTGYCARTCHVLKDVTQGRDADGLSGPRRRSKIWEGMLIQSSPSVDDEEQYQDQIRTMRNIKSVVNERQHNSYDLQERHPGSTEEYLIAWRTELRMILRTLDVRDNRLTVPTIPELP